MPRMDINLPENFGFSTTIPVRIGDINSGHHLDHASMVLIVQEARAQFLSSQGYSEKYDANSGLGFIIADLSIIYKKQVNYGQRLRIEVAAVDFSQKSFDIVYRLAEEQSGLEIARAKTGIVAFHYHQQQVIPVPESVKEKLSR
jgi:acyl-CoA thioester hydrolase